MAVVGLSPCIIISSFLTTLLLDRGVLANDSNQFPTSSPWVPSDPSSPSPKPSDEESEALKRVLPLVTFDCKGKTGYFTDSKFSCEVFHYCQPDGSRNTFHCPADQLFNQLSMICEAKTVHNSRLCKEGSINPSGLRPPSTKPSQTKDDSKSNSSREATPKKVMSLEELLSYINGGNVGKESEPTFISRFRTAETANKSKNLTENASQTDNLTIKENKEDSTLSSDAQLTAEGSDHTFSIAKVPSKQSKHHKDEGEDISAEYDAIEGRKFRKHKRLDRITDVSHNEDSKREEKPTARSAIDAHPSEDTTSSTAEIDSKNLSSHSLFSTDRSKARDFRKRKRYQGRKRKVPNSGTTNETETATGMTSTTVLPIKIRQEGDAQRNNANRRRKSQRTRTRDGTVKSLQSSSKSEHVEPYTLPPLPTPADDKVEVTTEMRKKEEPSKESPRAKNPWFKATTSPSDSETVKFGEKLSDFDQHHYQTDSKAAEGPAPPDYYEMKDIPNSSQEVYGEYSERDPLYSKNPFPDDGRSKTKSKNWKRKPEGDSFKHESHFEKHHPVDHDIFPPPRVESREHYTTPPQQMIHESSIEKSKAVHGLPKATTDDPFRVTHPYMEKYHKDMQQIKEMEEQRWKTNAEKSKSKSKKVAVGSTFFFPDDSPKSTKKPRTQILTAAKVPEEDSQKEDIPKHKLAHQHLSKIMNDFFAMSSPSALDTASDTSDKEEEDFVVPEYRIPEEDIYTGSESASDDEEIPPELLEVVDLLTGRVNNEKGDMKPQASHEVIKIDGPITDSQLEKIFLDEKFDEENEHDVSADGSYKQIVVLPQPDDKEEDIKEIAEVAEYTSLKLEPFLKQISGDKSVTVIPLKNEPVLKRQPTILTAKKIPVRVIYRDQLKENTQPRKPETVKPNIKLWHSHLPSGRVQIYPNSRRAVRRPVTHAFSSHSKPQIILHPSSLFPPHPPPLQRKQLPFRAGYPFVSNSGRLNLNTRPIHHRSKRSIISRLRRQIRQNQHFLPFSSRPVFPAFNPKFVPTFSPFRSLFRPATLHASSSHLIPFTFPGYSLAKATQNRPQIFQPNHPRPPPVRHVTQNGQTVIVEEVPIPIHVEVPSPSLIRPVPSASHPAKINSRYPGLRTPSPPAIQRPPLINRPQNRFPSTPGNYQPLGMPSNARPPSLNYRPPVAFAPGLPPSITSDGKLYALGVTNKPLPLPSSHPPRLQTANVPRNPSRPFNPYQIHPNSYPNFPYFQGAFTTPITNEPLPGRLMYSGYKPPKSTLGTKPPKSPSRSNKERKTSESKSNRSKTKPTQDYFETPTKPMRESHVSYTEEVISRGRTRPKPALGDYTSSQTDFNTPRQSLSKGNSGETPPRKRRPGRRRRPRPHSTTQGPSNLNDISPTPPPPEQIPPPPADYTSKPAHIETYNLFPSYNEGSKSHETSSNFPPAGYYGKDQLVQFFDSSSKAYPKSTSPKPRDMGENTSSAELDESFINASGEDGNQPAFGTRLKSNPGQSRNKRPKSKQPKQSPSQNTEVRARPSETMNQNTRHQTNHNRDFVQTRPNEESRTHIKNEKQPPRRRRPPPPRPRNRPPAPMTTPHTQVHHFNYNENMGNFYSVPRGLQTLVAPEQTPGQNLGGSTDMFGLPHPVINQNIYSLRPKEAPVDFNTNFFSVPAHVAQQQHTPLHQMNNKPMPESAREFFAAAIEESSKVPEASTTEEKEPDQKNAPTSPASESGENKSPPPPVRKLRKPKRKNRYNPHSNEQRDSAEASVVKTQYEQTTPRESKPVRFKEKPTTVATTTPEPRSTAAGHFNSPNDIKESSVTFKQRSPLLPKTIPEFSKSFLDGKVDYQKLNATISTSVSVTGGTNPQNNTSSEERENKRVFSSQNGGLAVVRKGPKRKRARQRVSTTTGVPYINNGLSNSDAKYEIAASVLDIIKATTETERQASGYYNREENTAPSRVSNIWVESKRTQ